MFPVWSIFRILAFTTLATAAPSRRSSPSHARHAARSTDTDTTFDGCMYEVEGAGPFTSHFEFDFTTMDTLPDEFIASTYEVGSGPYAPYSHVFNSDNIVLASGEPMQMIVPGGQTTDPLEACQFVTAFDDVLYASVRTVAQVSPVNGTVHGFFMYMNDTQECDIEIRTGNPGYIHYTNQVTHSGNAESTYAVAAPSDMTSAFHEYRYDWLPTETNFYVDGVLVQTITKNLPSTPGWLMWNNWANGYSWTWGPPLQDNILLIQSVEAYYNRTSTNQTCTTAVTSWAGPTNLATSTSSTRTSTTTTTSTPVPTESLCPATDGQTVNGYIVSCSSDTSISAYDNYASASSYLDCMSACDYDDSTGCVAWTYSGGAYGGTSGICYLKNGKGTLRAAGDNYISGVNASLGALSYSSSAASTSVATSTVSTSNGASSATQSAAASSSTVYVTSISITSSSVSSATSTSASSASTTTSNSYADGSYPTVGGVTFYIEADTSYSGSLMTLSRKRSTATMDDCLAMCAASSSCEGTSFNNSTSTCSYYSDFDEDSKVAAIGTMFGIVEARISESSTSTASQADSESSMMNSAASSTSMTSSTVVAVLSSTSSSIVAAASSTSRTASLDSATTTLRASSSVNSATSSKSASSSASRSSASSSAAASNTAATIGTTKSATTTTSTSSPSTKSSTSTPTLCPAYNNTSYTPPTATNLSFIIECGIDHSGGDLSMLYVASLADCIASCAATTGCVDVSLSGEACYLKQSVGLAVVGGSVQGARLVTSTASSSSAGAAYTRPSYAELIQMHIDRHMVVVRSD